MDQVAAAGARHIATFAMVFVFFINGTALAGGFEDEETVCGPWGAGWVEAPFFQSAADVANQSSAVPNVPATSYEKISLTEPNKPTLVGYRVKPANADGVSKAILFLQGNGVLAAEMVEPLTAFVKEGYDVFTFDYRGYGESAGRPLLRPVIADQSRVADFVTNRGYEAVYLYAISSGGILALASKSITEKFDATVVDATPAEIPWPILCPSAYDPVNNLPPSAHNILVLNGGLDQQVTLIHMEALRDVVLQRGGEFQTHEDLGHPLGQGPGLTKRVSLITNFFERF